MKINLEKLLELVPNAEEVCHRYFDIYYELAEKDNTQDKIRYIDILACMLGNIGTEGINHNYIIKKESWSDQYYIELECIYKVEDRFRFELTDYFEVEVGDCSYNIQAVLQAYEFMKEFNLIIE